MCRRQRGAHQMRDQIPVRCQRPTISTALLRRSPGWRRCGISPTIDRRSHNARRCRPQGNANEYPLITPPQRRPPRRRPRRIGSRTRTQTSRHSSGSSGGRRGRAAHAMGSIFSSNKGGQQQQQQQQEQQLQQPTAKVHCTSLPKQSKWWLHASDVWGPLLLGSFKSLTSRLGFSFLYLVSNY